MSAFLMYAQQKRRPLQWENPDMPNADISRLLGEMWRNASPSEKRPHLEREEEERRVYKVKMDKWKNNQKFENAFNPSPSKCRSRGGSTMPKVVALGETTGGEGMKRDRRQDVASLAREGEESHARSGIYRETDENHHRHQQSYNRQTDSSSPYEHRLDSSPWAVPSLPPPSAAATMRGNVKVEEESSPSWAVPSLPPPSAAAPAHGNVKMEEELLSAARVIQYSYPRPSARDD